MDIAKESTCLDIPGSPAQHRVRRGGCAGARARPSPSVYMWLRAIPIPEYLEIVKQRAENCTIGGCQVRRFQPFDVAREVAEGPCETHVSSLGQSSEFLIVATGRQQVCKRGHSPGSIPLKVGTTL